MSNEEIKKLQEEIKTLELKAKLKKLKPEKAVKKTTASSYKDNTSAEIDKLLQKKKELSKQKQKGFFGKLKGFAQQAQLNKEINIRKKSLQMDKATSHTKKQLEYLQQQEKLQDVKARISKKKKDLNKQLEEDIFKPHNAIKAEDIF